MNQGEESKRGRFDEGPVMKKFKIKKKVYPSVAQFPSVNFVELLEVDREKIERESNAILSMRGKGSNFPGEDDTQDPLHVLIEAENEEQGHKAERMVRDVLNDPSKLPPPVETQVVVRQSIFGHRHPKGDFNRAGGDFLKEIRVSEDVAGAIIGKAGETVRRLQAKSGARIHIARESGPQVEEGYRMITLRGFDQASVDKAEELVMEFVKNRGRPMVIAAADVTSTIEPYDHQRSMMITEHYLIPNHRAGAVIGRQGSTIKAMQAKYNARISVPTMPDQAEPHKRTLTITAETLEAVASIKREIDDIVEGRASFMGGPEESGTPYTIPDDKAGLIIGKQGSTIKSIQERMGVRIQIPSTADEGSRPPVRTATVIGKPEMVLLAIREIENILAGELTVPSATTALGPDFGTSGSLDGTQSSGYQTGSTGTQAGSDYSAQWEEYYRQLNLLPPEQKRAALEALAEHQKAYQGQM